MVVESKVCNVCGRQKQETNHWLVAITRPGMEGIMIVPADSASGDLGEAYQREDLCGQACTTKRLSQWLETLTATPPERHTA